MSKHEASLLDVKLQSSDEKQSYENKYQDLEKKLKHEKEKNKKYMEQIYTLQIKNREMDDIKKAECEMERIIEKNGKF